VSAAVTPDIVLAVSALHTTHLAEWRSFRSGMDHIEELVRAALGSYNRGDVAECHILCKQLLDAEHELLGDCHSETLTTLLGYIDPDPEAT
jgi:hypothetical protein